MGGGRLKDIKTRLNEQYMSTVRVYQVKGEARKGVHVKKAKGRDFPASIPSQGEPHPATKL